VIEVGGAAHWPTAGSASCRDAARVRAIPPASAAIIATRPRKTTTALVFFQMLPSICRFYAWGRTSEVDGEI
jgi:hypothetical protein